MHHFVLLALALVGLNSACSGGRLFLTQVHLFPQEGARTAEAIRVDRAPRLDGTLNDPLWQSAKTHHRFSAARAAEGEPATETTEVRILYTRHAVYLGFIATIPHHPES